ncbi:MAG TPA: hypothetical protein VG759_16995 [Candidatus Angelobacter sp.]|jgi:hypothetical protein|nr:hypothetical protein [Candidatus Angelobacter sp.]
MNAPHPVMMWLYRGALVLYPTRLRREYRLQMLQTLCDAYQDRPAGTLRFWLHAYGDLLQSSFMERCFMLRDLILRRPLVFHTFALAVILTLLGGAASVTMQQMLRRGANEPQIDMADYYAGEIGSGEEPGNVIPPGYVDAERSLQPFVIFYDDQGKPGPGTGYLDQVLPTPPDGVFDVVRKQGGENVTWQPRPGVRLASVIRRVHGRKLGFILAARSLRLVEQQEGLLWRIAVAGWIIVMVLLIGGASLLSRAQRVQRV